jgi:hypothetical protein
LYIRSGTNAIPIDIAEIESYFDMEALFKWMALSAFAYR